jgi:hypothetical protein
MKLMNGRDQFVRRALWSTAGFNVAGAYVFAFPSSVLGQLVGLPPVVPLLYRALFAFCVLLFGGTYAWLATQPTIDRALVAFSAIGKAGVFAVVFCLWLASEAQGRSVLVISGDLAFATVFAWWLWGEGRAMRVDAGQSAE